MATTSRTMIKDPDATLDYGIDWSSWLATGETISTSTWVADSGITTASPSNTTTTTQVRVSGGTAGVQYTLTNRITTSTGQINDCSLYIRIANR